MAPIADVAAWFTKENYEGHRTLDPNGLHPTFEEWLRNAERGVQEAKSSGVIIKPVVIEPDELGAWCKEHGRKVNGSARAQFAVIVAHKRSQN